MYQKILLESPSGHLRIFQLTFKPFFLGQQTIVIDRHKKVDIPSVFPPRKPQTESPCYGPKTMSLHNATYAVDEASNWRQPTK
jgi:hypothetical protein